MPNLSELLYDIPADSMVSAMVPAGYWQGQILSGKIYDKDNSGAPLTDKNGEVYARAVLFVRCDEPLDGVAQEAAADYFDADGPSETLVKYNRFIRAKRDIIALEKTLAACGALTTARSIDKTLEALKGGGVPCRVLVEHQEYNDDTVAVATELVPLN